MNRVKISHALLVGLALATQLAGQRAEIREVPLVQVPVQVDSNMPGFWRDGRYHIYTSNGDPMISSGANIASIEPGAMLNLQGVPTPSWVESVHPLDDGTLLVWYHHELVDVCPGKRLTTPVVGAALSVDGGQTLIDLGIVLQHGPEPNCNAENGYFAGGHGDFSVIFDQASGYFYFLFSNYSGSVEEQGIAIARLAWEHRFSPAGSAEKFYNGDWSEPGIGGKVTPIFPATVDWMAANAESYWGPSIHWNTHLNGYVMLLNRTCCEPGWPQEGVYVSFNNDLSNPQGWSSPVQLLSFGSWYPVVVGMGEGESDRLSGHIARLFTMGSSFWEIRFYREGEESDPEETPAEAAPEEMTPAPETPENPGEGTPAAPEEGTPAAPEEGTPAAPDEGTPVEGTPTEGEPGGGSPEGEGTPPGGN